jgi:hypothetical protein
MKDAKKGAMLTGSKKNGSTVHESSIKPGTGSGNLYNHVPKNAIDKQDVKSHGKYGI